MILFLLVSSSDMICACSQPVGLSLLPSLFLRAHSNLSRQPFSCVINWKHCFFRGPQLAPQSFSLPGARTSRRPRQHTIRASSTWRWGWGERGQNATASIDTSPQTKTSASLICTYYHSRSISIRKREPLSLELRLLISIPAGCVRNAATLNDARQCLALT